MKPQIYMKYLLVTKLLNNISNWDWSEKLSSSTRSLTYWAIQYKWIAEKIGNALESQRNVQRNSWLERFHHDTDHMRFATMEKQWPSIFYYAQRVFSLPEDYVFRPSNFSKSIKDYFDALVFQPELIPDELMINLWLMQAHDKIPSLTRKSAQQKMEIHQVNIERKIAIIPELKAILASAKSFQTGQESRFTGRILLLENGKYLLFQEHKQWTDERKKPNILYVPKVYDDMYSLLRSQEYGSWEINNTIENWKMILSDLSIFQTWWKMYSEKEKRINISNILMKMKYSKIPQVVSARKRLLAIEYIHDEKDANRILWAWNDIQNLVYSQEWKRWAIWLHWAMIAQQISNEEKKFDYLKSTFISKLKEMDVWVLENYLTQEGWKLSPDIDKNLNQAFVVLRRFVNTYISPNFIWEPFLSFVQKIHYEISLPKDNYTDFLRSLLKVILIIKQYAYHIGIYQIKHQLKKNWPIEQIIADIDSLVLLLDAKTFLPFIQLKPSGQERFENMKENLFVLKSNIISWETIAAFMHIESILDDLKTRNLLAKK